MSTIKLELDRSKVLCHIDIKGLEKEKQRSFKILLTNKWGNITTSSSIIKLSYFKLKRLLPLVAKWCKLKSVTIKVQDETLKNLLLRFSSDKKNIKGQETEKVKKKDIQKLLDQNGFKRELTNHQIEDVYKLFNLNNGANFSVPGAGKTTTLLALFTLMRTFGFAEKLLVICPINAFISWEDEVSDIYQGGLKISRLTKYELQVTSDLYHESDIYISNYEKFRSDVPGLKRVLLKYKVHNVLDESHRIKSGFSNQSFEQILDIGDFSVRRDIMSGTPMPQEVDDLESQFEYLWATESIVPKTTELEIINEGLKNFYVRQTKSDIKLEPLNIINNEVQMGVLQQELYNLLKSESARMLTSMDTESKNSYRFLGKSVIRLMQASSNPMLLTSNEDIYSDVDGFPPETELWKLLEDYNKYEFPIKFKVIKERINEILKNSSTKVLIWSVFVKNILFLQELLKEYNPAVIYGGVYTSGDETIEESREGQIRKFHSEPSCKVMIANPQACGEGISLHKVCHHAIYLERNYNAAHYLQSMDRIHRYGLKPGTITNIELIITSNSLDARIDSRLNEKIQNMGEVLEDKFLKKLAYDPYDLKDDEFGLDNQDLNEVKNYLLS